MPTYHPTIGLEVHAELKTQSKMFCDCLNDAVERVPNVNVCPVCLGHPGCLPVPNKRAIEFVMLVGFALHGEVAVDTKFDRKNYFYPDLPKGYQISQYDMPIVSGGYIEIENNTKIELERVHLEEDTARIQHADNNEYSLIDFNRSSVPLMELVTKPVMHSADQARAFAKELQQILRYLDISDAELENGLMRVELNISLAPEGSDHLGTKVEIKNLNSLSALEGAAQYEIERQTQLLEKEERVVQETRGWDENKRRTFSQRVKEEASDYRYFPEPDIPPFKLLKEQGFDRDEIMHQVPELPLAKARRFAEQYKHNEQEQAIFVTNKSLADYYEQVVSEFLEWSKDRQQSRDELIRVATNYTVKNVRTLLEQHNTTIDETEITPENFAEFIYLVQQGTLTNTAAQQVLDEMVRTGGDPTEIMKTKGLEQQSSASDIQPVVEEVLKENEPAVRDYKNGKEQALKFLLGQCMARSKGAFNPAVVEKVLRDVLG